MICLYNYEGGPLATGITAPFTGMGLGALADAITCKVTEKLNGEYTATLTYPVNGANFANLQTNAIFTAKPNPFDDPQPFRIARITKPIGGIVTVYAEHIRYDLSKIPVKPFAATGIADTLTKLKSNELIASRFSFLTSRTSILPYSVKAPRSISSVLGGSGDSILDVYGGEWGFDGYTCTLYEKGGRGQNRGVVIRYGKNMTDLKQEENIANVSTGVYPFWQSASDASDILTLPEEIVPAPGTYQVQKNEVLDLSSNFTERPSVAELRAAAENYVTEQNVGIPEVSLSVNFVALADTEEYHDLVALERVSIGDTVRVVFSGIGVDATARVISTVYDAVTGRFDSLEIGEAKQTAAQTIAGAVTAANTASNTASAAQRNTSDLREGLIAGTTTVNGDCIKTGTIESNNYQETPGKIFSDAGTLLKLLDGVIKSPYFAVDESGTVHFGGFHVFSIEALGETTKIFQSEDEDGTANGDFSIIDSLVRMKDLTVEPQSSDDIRVSLKIKSYGRDTDYIRLQNDSGDELLMEKDKAILEGSWKATPYTNANGAESEIVTKQDLINLGLITE